MNARNKVFILLGILFLIALVFYLTTTPRGSDLDAQLATTGDLRLARFELAFELFDLIE